MEKLEFTSDQNNLLQMQCFPVLRKENPVKYGRHKTYEVWSGSKAIGIVECVSISVVPFCNLTTSMGFLMYGKSLRYLQAIIGRMYPGTDWTANRLYFMMMLFKKRYQEQPPVPAQQHPSSIQGTLPLGVRTHRSN